MVNTKRPRGSSYNSPTVISIILDVSQTERNENNENISMFNVGVVHGNIVPAYIDTTLAGIVCMV